jgi:deoxyribodipyrimidine photolyase
MQQIEMLQEEALQVAEEIAEAQHRIKQVVEEDEEKQKTHIIADLVETILVSETKVKGKTNTTKEVFDKFKEKLKKS